MNRAALATAALLVAAAPVRAMLPARHALVHTASDYAGSSGRAFLDLLELSLKEKKGLTIRVQGKSIPGVVIRLFASTVEVRKPDHARILIRLDRIEAVALN